MLKIENLSVSRGNKDIINDLSFEVRAGELVAIVGPNGVGKSTVALTLFGHPDCRVTAGSMAFDGVDLVPLPIHARAKLGMFLAHQEPPALPGVSVTSALRLACDATRETPFTTAAFFDKLRESLAALELTQEFADRNLHEAFSGGEKKRAELLFLLMLAPKFAVLDELDSGMDEQARGLAIATVERLRAQGTAFLVISHNEIFLQALSPSRRVELG